MQSPVLRYVQAPYDEPGGEGWPRFEPWRWRFELRQDRLQGRQPRPEREPVIVDCFAHMIGEAPTSSSVRARFMLAM